MLHGITSKLLQVLACTVCLRQQAQYKPTPCSCYGCSLLLNMKKQGLPTPLHCMSALQKA
jgi:hypothetical protein